jgi:diguanylate cyclase
MKPSGFPGVRAGTYPLLRISAVLALLAQLGIRFAFPDPSPLPDLILFNGAVYLAAGSAYFSPLFNDRWAAVGISAGLAIWATGSTISTAESFFSPHFHLWRGFSDISYSLFYPLILLGILRALSSRKALRATELLDISIIGLGTSSALASLLLKTAMVRLDGSASAVFMAILYPIGDIVLLVVVLLSIWMQKPSYRTYLMLAGISLFAATDLNFIWRSATSGYSFASLVDDGWVIGLILISESLWHHGGERELSTRVIPIATLLSLIVSSSLLALAVIQPNELPRFILIPAFATLILSFLRMSIALREAREIKDERVLARTDELTGLPNRRQFMAVLDGLKNRDATLLLMDLDGFKTINDTLGHDAGDELLRQISVRFARQIPKGDLIARLGGDEFGALIYGDTRHGLEIGNSLRASLAYPANIGSHSVTLGVSIGAIKNDNQPELMRRADEAMYLAKRSGLGIQLFEL